MQSSVSSVIHPTNDMKYAAIYARVSTEDQGKGFSIPTQIEACQKLAAREGSRATSAINSCWQRNSSATG
jgi:Resolvase, N terminal domain